VVRLRVKPDASIILLTGDIIQQDVDAIVNAANAELAPGGGVCGAIHRAGGPAIYEECKIIRRNRGPLPTGQAVATTAGRMKARYVIHTVGPVWHGGGDKESQQLAACYRESLRLADELGLTSIACPSVSTGIFGYPVDQAALVALHAVQDALKSATKLKEVRFVLFDEVTMRAYSDAARHLNVKCEI
jgi:O-acetyl-ADP-ribose deacetylase (regulator of RNase III)